MSTLLYSQHPSSNNSSASFLNSAPVEISTVKGYQDFLNARKTPTNTIFSDDKTSAYVLASDVVIATVRGRAMEHLLAMAGETD
ncbi:hypothetical protein TBLA_0I02210 [Henningerozyma blattae CBS 6284]|uniref:Uncharacterized protein n=1 Tax=Henningerozyma blattae (strain ATCC 34711 / CBS 6284 / DSM 70876 / NBRC 10599 / NRRL Y-10934 / UCD 77-7) TaxID=1071380 RepID=I2H927_HENB6|nr:hypothetical protein TBLA_0I02210 [Tetrapisispora blattae CBS 6284]CCH62879.1 hypothetical protein TBLA_0I02210 [Tetrapisispora blattae CBS 6284]